MTVDAESVLFVTLDSCRYDTFVTGKAPHLKAVAPLHRAQAPGHFTYGSHAAMFVGFTPSVPGLARPLLDNKFSKIFKIVGPGFSMKGGEGFTLQGRSIMAGFRAVGYRTFGTGAAGWFDPETDTGRNLTDDFEEFFYPGNTWSLGRQVAWLEARVAAARGPVFAFINVGETHVPYYYEGAPWDRADNPCQPYNPKNRADVCRERQRLCLEHVDAKLAALLAAFAGATVIVCSDHGDCWGEDGLWEHGVSHPMTLTVPLLVRLRGAAIR